ncbi:hypothetical protein K402DRAFT_145914 [Aulographum hederae CBS 113979]|uniref:50S ribosomal protein YmL27 n=1 Tax=Aulographum hederae CBS 113979 TaxID=1176131 RepID=A0A6G1GTT5_9PEZI|nr:hypothetical protein K402DRAFT_145914 [Aulographum hederae CBS 113979]
MFHPTHPLGRAIRRLQLTTKQAGKNYYKGNRVGSMGRHTKRGKYIIEWAKVRTYVVPDLSAFKLSPFVTKKIEKPEAVTDGGWRIDSGEQYLANWKNKGGRT